MVKQLTAGEIKAVSAFRPRMSYGPTLPKGVAGQVKPKLARFGLLSRTRREATGTVYYTLSVLGERVAQAIETGTGETAGLDPKDESAVRQDAPDTAPNPTPTGDAQ